MNTDKIYAESIAKEYAPRSTSKVVALKKLDRKAKSAANIFAYCFGVIGLIGVGINYPVYNKLLEKGKKKFVFEIMQLAKEICERAGVNRSTFYLHYETMADLLNECLEQAKRNFDHSFKISEEEFIAQINEALS